MTTFYFPFSRHRAFAQTLATALKENRPSWRAALQGYIIGKVKVEPIYEDGIFQGMTVDRTLSSEVIEALVLNGFRLERLDADGYDTILLCSKCGGDMTDEPVYPTKPTSCIHRCRRCGYEADVDDIYEQRTK
jgi:hypothetical protein